MSISGEESEKICSDGQLFQPLTKVNMVIKKYHTSKNEEKIYDNCGNLELKNFNSLLFTIKSKETKNPENIFKLKGFYINLFFLTFSIFGTILMFGTNWYDNTIQQILTFKEDGFVFKLWRDTTADCICSIYIFNYTNVDEILSGKEKPKVKEIGPYVFRQEIRKWNVEFNGTQEVTYSENFTNTFMREYSAGSLDDIVLMPNLFILSVLDSIKNVNKFTQIIIKTTLMKFPPFLNLTVEELILGFDNKLGLIKDAMSIVNQEKIMSVTGIIKPRDGLIEDRITIGTGIPDLNKFGIIKAFNGKSELTDWNNNECNSFMDTSNGLLFPGKMIKSKKPLYSYTRILCRKLVLVYDKPSFTPQGYPANRYIFPHNMFSSGKENTRNKCYSNNSDTSGIFKISNCYFGSPIVLSFPHYLYSDQSGLYSVDGLTPDPLKHSTDVYINDFGVLISGAARLQAGIILDKLPYYTPYKYVKDGTIFPITWLEIKADNLTGVPNQLVYHLSHTVPLIRNLLKWISVISFIIFLLVLITYFYRL